MTLFHPEDWGAMLKAVADWAQANVPTFSDVTSGAPEWFVAYGKHVPTAEQPPKPFVVVNILTPPIQDGRGDQSPELFKGCAVQVENVLNSTLYRIVYNGTDADFTSDVDAELQEILTGLIGSVNIAAGATVATQVLNVIQISGNPTIDVDSDPNLSLKRVRSTEAEATVTFQIDCIGRDDAEGAAVNAGPQWESVAAMSRLQLSLDTAEVREQLKAAGWSFISREGERKPDIVVGTQWEDRSGFDIRLRCRTRDLRIGDFIEDAPIDSSIVGQLSP